MPSYMKTEHAQMKNVTKMYNQTVETNGTVDDFLKSLPNDNAILAEMICPTDSNDTSTN